MTIIPIPFKTDCEEGDLGRSTLFFPFAGLTIGGFLVALNIVLSPFLARSLVDAMLVAALAIITGCLHLDGLADVCDGLAARGNRERFLLVMKDSHVGAAGAVAVVLGLLLKWLALAAVPLNIKWQALLLFPMISRTAQVVAMGGVRHARSDGLGTLFIHGLPRFAPLIATVIALIAAGVILPLQGLAALCGVLVLSVAIRAYFQKRLGGLTGDILGCINEVSEITGLIIISANFSPNL